MTRPIEQHMRVTVCRWCGALATECGGTCVSATPEIGTPCPERRKMHKAREVWKWPEWKAFASRLGLVDIDKITDCSVHLPCNDVARVTVTYIPVGETCQQHQSGTAHMEADAEQSSDHHQPSEDTTTDGAN